MSEDTELIESLLESLDVEIIENDGYEFIYCYKDSSIVSWVYKIANRLNIVIHELQTCYCFDNIDILYCDDDMDYLYSLNNGNFRSYCIYDNEDFCDIWNLIPHTEDTIDTFKDLLYDYSLYKINRHQEYFFDTNDELLIYEVIKEVEIRDEEEEFNDSVFYFVKEIGGTSEFKYGYIETISSNVVNEYLEHKEFIKTHKILTTPDEILDNVCNLIMGDSSKARVW